MQIIIVRYLSSVWTLKNTYPETKVKPDCLKWYYLLGNGWALSSESACLFVFYLKYTESEKVVWKGVCIDHWWLEQRECLFFFISTANLISTLYALPWF